MRPGAAAPGWRGVRSLPKQILVVDDQFGIRVLLREVLEREGYTVHLAAGGTEALSLLQRHAPDLVLLDMKIPGMDGLEILARVRRLVPTQRVIMMTAYGELDLVKEASALGAIGHFTKPFDIDELRRSIAQALGD